MKWMPRSVTISTPVPTLEEFGESLGLSKRRQGMLLRLARRGAASDGVVVRRVRETSGGLADKATVSRSKK